MGARVSMCVCVCVCVCASVCVQLSGFEERQQHKLTSASENKPEGYLVDRWLYFSDTDYIALEDETNELHGHVCI